MQDLGMSISEIDRTTPQRIYEYVVILSELGKIRKEKMEERRNA